MLNISFLNQRVDRESNLFIPLIDIDDAKKKAKELKIKFDEEGCSKAIGPLRLSIYQVEGLTNVKPITANFGRTELRSDQA